MGGVGELKALPVAWYDWLARILTKVEEIGVWPDGLLDAYTAMIPKVDGSSGLPHLGFCWNDTVGGLVSVVSP